MFSLMRIDGPTAALKCALIILATYTVSAGNIETAAKELFGLERDALFAGACPAPASLYDRGFYTLCFLPDRKIPVWVAVQISADALSGTVDRTDDFRADLGLAPENRALLADYANSGFDRGHMAEAELFRRNQQAMSMSFLLSNMAPQTKTLNRGRWRSLEADVRRWIRGCERSLTFTGNLFLDESRRAVAPSATIGSGVQVPTHNFKAALCESAGKRQAIAFLLANRRKRNPGPNSRYATSIDSLEELAHFDLFAFLPDSVERAAEREFVLPEVFE